MLYEFENVEIEIEEDVYLCSGAISYTYVPSEPDEPFGYSGATPGYAAHVEDVALDSLNEAILCDQHGNEFDFKDHAPKRFAKAIEDYFESKYEILTEYHENYTT